MSIEIKISNKPIPYNKAVNIMEKRVNDIKNGKKNDLIWILEHPIIFTAGVRSKENEILDKNIEVIKTNRGGKITLHNPGQKIIYLVFNLNNKKRDIRNFIYLIEKSIIEFLNIYKIKGKSDRKNIGIWVKKKKIAAIGLKIKKWITYHGCSINIKNDLSIYKKILPCGLSGSNVTSMKEQKINNFKDINKNLKRFFKKFI